MAFVVLPSHQHNIQPTKQNTENEAKQHNQITCETGAAITGD